MTELFFFAAVAIGSGQVYFWPTTLAGLVLIFLRTTPTAGSAWSWWRAAFLLAGASLLVSVPLTYWLASDPVANVLPGDIATVLILAPVMPLVYAVVVRTAQRATSSPRLQVVVCLAAILAGSFISFMAVLSAHCSTGDCL